MIDSPAVILYDENGVALAVADGVLIPANTPGLLAAGKDGGGVARVLLTDTASRLVAAGAGVAGTPAGGVFSIQGVVGGTPLIVDPSGTDQPVTIEEWLGSTAPTVGQKAMAASIPVVVASNQTGIPVTGPLTDAQLRATPVDVLGPLTDAELRAVPVDVLGPLTDAELRATPVDVLGPLTDVELRATPVDVLGPLTDAELRAAAVDVDASIVDWFGSAAPTVGQKAMAASIPVVFASNQSALDVTGPLTDAELRATPVDVLGPLTDAELRATPVPVSDGGGSLTVDSLQLPAALVGGRLDTNLGSWLGAVTPTVGQKTMAASLPFVLASNQPDIAVVGPLTDAELRAAPVDVLGPLTDTELRATPIDVLGPLTDAELRAASVDVDASIVAWFGSSAPTVGQKVMANSIPVVIASDQAIAVTGTFDNNSVGPTGDPIPDEATLVGGSDGTDLQAARVFDGDSGGGSEFIFGAILRKSASGGSVEAGTSADPLRFDPTGTTAQPVTDNGGSLTVDTPQLPAALVGGRLDVVVGAALPAGTNNIGDVDILSVPAPLSTTGGGTEATALRVTIANNSTGLLPVTATQLPAALVGGRLDENVGAWLGSTAPTVGQKTMANSLPVVVASDNGLALDATLTGGTQKAIARGGAKGATAAADVTSTAEGADHQALDIQVYHGGAAVNPTAIRALTASDVVSAEINDWLGSTAPTVGQKTMANSVPVVIASDQTTPTSATATLSNVSNTAVNATLLSANASRKGAMIYNDSNLVLYVKFGTTATTTSFTVRMASQAYYEVPFGYTGRIDGISTATDGSARITEMT